jgi:dihydrofolate reductase
LDLRNEADRSRHVKRHTYADHMGRMLYWMNVSLDLFIEGDVGEEGQGEWLRIDEELHREFNRRAARLRVMVNGRVVYEIMEEAWPTFASDQSVPDYMQEYGKIWLETPKILVSRIRTEAGYNTHVVGGEDGIDQLRRLRDETDGTIGVGGANLATQIHEAGLLDELLLFTHPVVLRSGRHLFDRLERPLELDLIEEARFDNGVTMHHYALRS